MISMHSKYDNISKNGILNALVCINNSIIACLNYMLSIIQRFLFTSDKKKFGPFISNPMTMTQHRFKFMMFHLSNYSKMKRQSNGHTQIYLYLYSLFDGVCILRLFLLIEHFGNLNLCISYFKHRLNSFLNPRSS